MPQNARATVGQRGGPGRSEAAGVRRAARPPRADSGQKWWPRPRPVLTGPVSSHASRGAGAGPGASSRGYGPVWGELDLEGGGRTVGLALAPPGSGGREAADIPVPLSDRALGRCWGAQGRKDEGAQGQACRGRGGSGRAWALSPCEPWLSRSRRGRLSGGPGGRAA